MLKQRGLAALVILFGLCFAAAVGQDKDKDKDKNKEQPKDGKPVELKWKFEKDKSFYQDMTTKTKQTMKVMGSEVVQNQDQTFYFKFTPKEEKDGNWTVEQEITGVKMNIDIGGSKIQYDSTSTSPATNPLSDFFKALIGSKFKLTIDKNLKVTKVEGRQEFLDKLIKANPQMKPLLEQILSDEALKEMADPTFAAVPNKEVKPGETWTRDTKLNMGPIGTYENSYKYTYKGPKDKQQQIDVDTTLKYTPPGESTSAGGLPFKIKSADLKSTKASGTILFNTETGRIDNTTMEITLGGTLKIEIGGQETNVDLTQEQKTTVTTSDKDPLSK